MRRILYFVASSLDGFIARADGGIDWLFTDQDYGYTDFLAGIDTVVMGRKTYEVCLSFEDYPYTAQNNYVFSRNQSHFAYAEATREPVSEFVDRLRRQPGKDIWLIGGGELAGAFFDASAVDEVQVFVHPTLIGSGLPLASGLTRDVKLRFDTSHAFDTGLVKLVYTVEKDRAES